jgi:hypothetical protein
MVTWSALPHTAAMGYDDATVGRLLELVARLERGCRHRGLVVSVVIDGRPLPGDLVFVLRPLGPSFEPYPVPDEDDPDIWVVGVVVVRAER